MLNRLSVKFPEQATVDELDLLLTKIAKRNFVLLTVVLGFSVFAYFVVNTAGYIYIMVGIFSIFCFYCSYTFDRRSLAINQRIIVSSMMFVLFVIILSEMALSGLVYYVSISVYITYVEKNRNWQIGLQSLNVLCFSFAVFYYWDKVLLIEDAAVLEMITIIDMILVVLFTGSVIRTYERHKQLAYSSTEVQTKTLAAHVEETRKSNLNLTSQKAKLVGVRNEATDSLRNMRLTSARLAASQEQLEQFTYAASHDLKEPIRTVRSFIQVVEKRLSPELKSDSSVSEYLEHIKRASWGMHEMLTNLLLFSRVGRLPLKRTSIALGDFCAKQLTAFAKTKPLVCRLEVQSGSDVHVDMDKKMLESAIAHLLDNSCKFIDEGLTPSISISIVEPKDGFVEMILSDNGIGIPVDYHQRVLHLFSRLHTREKYAGSGVGLALVDRIVERHGGAVWIGESQAEGCSVHLRLPIVKNLE